MHIWTVDDVWQRRKAMLLGWSFWQLVQYQLHTHMQNTKGIKKKRTPHNIHKITQNQL